MHYIIKVDPTHKRVLFRGIGRRYAVLEQALWLYYEDSGIVVVKNVGSRSWSSRGESSYYPAQFMVLRITERAAEREDGWSRAEEIVSFPIRKKQQDA